MGSSAHGIILTSSPATEGAPVYPTGNMTRPRDSMLWVVLPCLGLYLCMAAWFLLHGVEAIDDAYISLRYARNLVRGAGLVYNPGEFVQGYTNFLWVLIMAGVLSVGLPAVPTLCALGGLAGAAVVTLTAVWSFRRLAPGLRISAGVAPVLLASNLGLVVWSLRGLETGLFTLLILSGGLLYLRRGPLGPLSMPVALLFALAALTRPEGVLAFALTLGHLILVRLRQGRAPLSRDDVPGLALFLVVLGVYGAWTTWYYGDLLPNTFHAKVGGPLASLPRGLGYLWKFGRYGTGLPLLLIPLSLLSRRRRDHTRSYACIMTAGFALYVAAVGGDVFPAYRFLIPVLPFFYLLVADAVAVVEERWRHRQATARRWWAGEGLIRGTLALVLAVLALATFRPSSAFAWREWRGGNRYTRSMLMVGNWLHAHEPPGTWIAVNPAGALPYAADLPAIDMLGLTDREIAGTPISGLGTGRLAGHEKGNGASVLRRRPELILMSGVKLDVDPPTREWNPHGRSEHEIAATPDLYRIYGLEQQAMPDGRILTFLRRREP